MGLLDRFRREKALTATPAVVEAIRAGQFNNYQRLGGVNQQVNAAWLQTQSSSYAFMYEHQPAVRRVVDYIARNAAQLGLKLFERVSDTERERDTEHGAALTMQHPNDLGPPDQFIRNFVADFLVHDNAYALKFRGGPSGKLTLIQVPPQAVGVNSNARFTIDSYRIYRSDATYFDVDPADVIHWRGYNPSDPRIGVSRLETLRQILAEEAASQAASTELMKSGLSKPGYIKRPLEAPEWTEAGRSRFQEGWANQAKSSPRKTPVLEEGMEFADFGVSPKDAEMLAGREFTNDQVAALYGMEHCPPEDDDERKQFLADVLAPLSGSLSKQLDFSILLAEFDERGYYFEFDLNEKLRGDLENRFPAMTAAAGRPWRTVNETRALENLPPIEGGDELTIPLNVALSGDDRTSPQLPAANVMPPQDPNKPPADGSFRENPKAVTVHVNWKALETTSAPRRVADMARQRRNIDELKAALERYYSRQARVLKSKGSKAADSERWNTELSADLKRILRSIVEREGGIYAAHLGAADFDMRQVEHYVEAMAEGTAEGLNRATQRDIDDVGVTDALDRASNQRAAIAAASIGAQATVFARKEAATQAPGAERRVQTWIANSGRHADLDGVSVPLGSDWGGISPGSEPNCACTASIT